MKTIVIDLDNTIAIYDSSLLSICKQMEVKIPKNYKTKIKISDYLKSNGKNELWTKIQGICYGPKMSNAIVAEGFKKFVKIAKKLEYSLILVSHKTEFPSSGLNFNLRNAANNWLIKNLHGTFDQIFFDTFENLNNFQSLIF